MSDKAYITSKILKWARESARMTIEMAATKVPTTVEKLQGWEDGIDYPTIRQAEILAKAYKRPFALFFLPEIPKDFQPLTDYRKSDAQPLGTASIFIIREMQQKQAWISEVFQDNNDRQLPFVGKFSVNDDPTDVAADILQTLGIDPQKYTVDTPIKEWIDKAEANGIFISRTSFIHTRLKLDSDELQGFAIADKFAPFIFINSEDWSAPQLFTIVHELAHIWIAASGISNEIHPDLSNREKISPLEIFCNEVAANALLPLSIMNSLDRNTFASGDNVFKTVRKYGVSSFAFLVRALNLRLISFDQYKHLKNAADIQFKAFLAKEDERKAKQKESPGGPNPYLIRLQKNGRLFTQIVLDAFRGGHIEPTQASSLLNTKVNDFSKLEAILYR